MAMEPLTEDMNKKREEKAKEALIAAPAENTESTEKMEDDKKDRYDRLIARHGVPDKPKFIHKREQVYLMVEQNLSDAFVGVVIDYSSQTIDRLRMAAFVTGEEFLKTLITKKEPSEEQIREWIYDYMKAAVGPDEIKPLKSSVEKSLDIMGRHMVRQQEIASAQVTRLTEYIRQINEMDRDKNERELHAIRTERQKEREAARKQIELLSDENFRLNMKIEEAQEEAKKEAARAKPFMAADPAGEAPVMGEGIFACRRRMKEKRRREDFIAAVLRNGEFSTEQLEVINRVIQKNFTLPQLQKICDPQVKPENMELLEAYYERKQMHG